MSKEDRKDFYPIISRGLRRPVFAVYRRVQRDYDPNNHKGVYSPAELAKLHELLQVRRVLLLTNTPPLRIVKSNRWPKGYMWSAIPVALLYMIMD